MDVPQRKTSLQQMNTSPSDSAFLATLEAAIQGTNTVKYCCVAGIAWMVYDILINLDREIKYFWFPKSNKWSFPRMLYFLNRYFSPARVALFVFGLFHPVSDQLYVSNLVMYLFLMPLQLHCIHIRAN
ncbi:hypothetical protein B0H19DRAFT_1375117, partial [Mycena capillaripes]